MHFIPWVEWVKNLIKIVLYSPKYSHLSIETIHKLKPNLPNSFRKKETFIQEGEIKENNTEDMMLQV